MEIGSEFWLDGVPSEPGDITPEWIDRFGNNVLTSCCRGAISLLLQEAQPKAKSALLPGYTCDSVIQPFVTMGYECHFYDVGKDLAPDPGSINEHDDVGVFLHMGYFGFPSNSVLSDVVKKFRAASTLIVEDVTHSIFSSFKRFEENDYYAASIRKWVGIPSGGFLASPTREIQGVMPHNETFADIRREALLTKARYVDDADATLKSRYLAAFAEGEEYLNGDSKPYHIDSLSRAVIGRLDVDELRERRRRNYAVLSEGLKGNANVTPVFAELPDDVCPLFFPVYVTSNREDLKQLLVDNDIYATVHWPVPEQVQSGRLKNVSGITDAILSIPCDQRYSSRDMERVLEVVGSWTIPLEAVTR